ncbi:TonB-dependent receptor [Arcticibacter tournemirensis]
MRKFYLCTLAILLSILLYLPSSAQENEKLFSGSYRNLTLTEFIKKISAGSDYKFYYDPARGDSLKINIDASGLTLDRLLRSAFNNTKYYYTIDRENLNVFITYGQKIITGLPSELLAINTSIPKKAPDDISPVEDFHTNEKVIPSASLENKLYEVGPRSEQFSAGNATLAGYIKDIKTGEPVIGASVFIENPRTGITTNQFGYYSITIPKGRHLLNITGVGIKSTKRRIALYANGSMNIEIQNEILSLKEVVISSEKAANVRNVQMGVEKLTIEKIKQVPVVFGEADVLRVVLTLPGVKSVGEASTGFNVRGGATDQNLILFNDATIYNPSHFFGFFSAFNSEVVKDVELFKSSIPANYGGRLSSVLAVNSREGNKKKFTGSAGIGLLTSRFNMEGPLLKDRTSFILGGRTTYSDWMLKALPGNADYKNSKASFSDVDLHISHQINENNNLYFTGYYSNDNSNLSTDTTYQYNNRNISLKWKHIFNNKLFGVFTGGYDGYRYKNYSSTPSIQAYQMKFDINQAFLKTDFNYYLNSKHTLNIGSSAIYYWLNPGSFTPDGEESLIVPQIMESEKGIESAIYINDRYEVNSALSLNLGIRYSMYNSLGAKTVNRYAAGVPIDETNVIETVYYKKGDIIKTYGGPEYRLSARYALTSDFSVKAAYNTMRQYIHMLSNTTAIAPTDIWKLSDLNIKPQYGDQVSLGFYKNFKSNTIETSVEVYYKRLKDYLDYKSGATIVLNPTIERDVINTQGKAYGVELMLKKQTGKFNGWVSYTYSRIMLKMDDPTTGELINRGEYYPGNYDKPHDVTVVGNFRFTHRYSFSLNTTYSTGRPITLPIGKYWYGDAPRLLYSDRNEYRIPDYFRTDIGFNIEGNHKVKQATHNYFTIGVYNITGRKNAYSTYYTSENGTINGYKLSIFGSPVPYINYNIRF